MRNIFYRFLKLCYDSFDYLARYRKTLLVYINIFIIAGYSFVKVFIDKINKVIYSTPFLICCYNIVVGFFNILWFPGEVALPLIIVGGCSAFYYIFIARSYEEIKLSLLSFIINNITVFYILIVPDTCCFLVGLFLILLAYFHLFLFFRSYLIFDLIFIPVLLSRIFYNHQMGSWGFDQVTELMFIRIVFILCLKKVDRSEEGSIIEPLLYLIPLFGISFINFIYLDNGIKDIVIHINFLLASAALIFFTFIANRKQELIISFLLYIIGNLAIGYLLSISLWTFFQITSVFMVTNGMFASVYLLKAQRIKKPLSEILLANNRKGIHDLLIVYILILQVLLNQLNPGSDANSMYLNWIMWLGIKIGFLTALNYLFLNEISRTRTK